MYINYVFHYNIVKPFFNITIYILVKTIALKHAEKGDYDLINVLWIYYFEQKNDLEASKLWHDYIIKMELFRFNNILSYSQKTNDVGLAWKLLTQMQTHPKVDTSKIGYIYSRILSLLSKYLYFI